MPEQRRLCPAPWERLATSFRFRSAKALFLLHSARFTSLVVLRSSTASCRAMEQRCRRRRLCGAQYNMPEHVRLPKESIHENHKCSGHRPDRPCRNGAVGAGAGLGSPSSRLESSPSPYGDRRAQPPPWLGPLSSPSPHAGAPRLSQLIGWLRTDHSRRPKERRFCEAIRRIEGNRAQSLNADDWNHFHKPSLSPRIQVS